MYKFKRLREFYRENVNQTNLVVGMFKLCYVTQY